MSLRHASTLVGQDGPGKLIYLKAVQHCEGRLFPSVGALIALRNSDTEGLGAKTDYKTEHGQAAIPGLSECDETEAGRGISHECFECYRI